MPAATLRFIFISEPNRPVVTITLPGSRLFQEAFVMAAKEQGKDPSNLTCTYPGGTPLDGRTVEEVGTRGTTIHVIDPAIVGSVRNAASDASRRVSPFRAILADGSPGDRA